MTAARAEGTGSLDVAKYSARMRREGPSLNLNAKRPRGPVVTRPSRRGRSSRATRCGANLDSRSSDWVPTCVRQAPVQHLAPPEPDDLVQRMGHTERRTDPCLPRGADAVRHPAIGEIHIGRRRECCVSGRINRADLNAMGSVGDLCRVEHDGAIHVEGAWHEVHIWWTATRARVRQKLLSDLGSPSTMSTNFAIPPPTSVARIWNPCGPSTISPFRNGALAGCRSMGTASSRTPKRARSILNPPPKSAGVQAPLAGSSGTPSER